MPVLADRLEVAVTLDNSRTARSVTYGFETSFQLPLQPPHLGDDGTAHVAPLDAQ